MNTTPTSTGIQGKINKVLDYAETNKDFDPLTLACIRWQFMRTKKLSFLLVVELNKLYLEVLK